MAGIGFALRKLVQRDDLNGVVQAFSYSAFAAAGPWMFTILCLLGINIVGLNVSNVDEVEQFRLVVVYNNCFALLIVSPIAVIATRFTADRIYDKDVHEVPSILIVSLLMTYTICTLFAFPLYFWVADMKASFAILSVICFSMLGGIAVVGVFLTALKDYYTISWVFLIGMLISFLSAWFLAADYGADGMLVGFIFGLMFINFIITTKIFAEYPYHYEFPYKLFGYFKKHWELALGIFLYNAGAWVDKWVMWLDPETHRRYDNNLIANPAYDSAMFLAYLSIVPAVSIFTVILEANFFEKYVIFYRDIMRHCSWLKIQENHRNIIKVLIANSKDLGILQAAFSIIMILISHLLIELFEMNYLQMGMFRIGVLGALFHVFLLYILIILIYFELKREVLLLQLFFFLSNGILSIFSMEMGFPYYGYGYFASTLLTMCIAYSIAVIRINDLPYLTFIANNPSTGGKRGEMAITSM
jgi:polysaccharide biosynthesis protein PelG